MGLFAVALELRARRELAARLERAARGEVVLRVVAARVSAEGIA